MCSQSSSYVLLSVDYFRPDRMTESDAQLTEGVEAEIFPYLQTCLIQWLCRLDVQQQCLRKALLRTFSHWRYEGDCKQLADSCTASAHFTFLVARVNISSAWQAVVLLCLAGT